MMKGLILMLCLLPSGCAIPNARAQENVISQEYLLVARNCIDAQVKIDSPMFNSRTKRPIRDDINIVQVGDVQDLDFYTVSLQSKNIYPDAPVAWCRVEKNTGLVISASYQIGESELDSREIIFISYDSTKKFSEEELDLLIVQEKITEFPIILLFNNGVRRRL